MAGSAAANEQGPHRLRPAERRQFPGQGVEVAVAEVILADRHREIAVAAVVSAKRDVDVGGPRPAPRRGVKGSSPLVLCLHPTRRRPAAPGEEILLLCGTPSPKRRRGGGAPPRWRLGLGFPPRRRNSSPRPGN